MSDSRRTVPLTSLAETESGEDQERTTLPGPAAPPFPPASAATRYVLGDELARGGMGVVYRAADTALGREVAVKVLKAKYSAGSGAAGRFADEARITGQLQHPAIPPVHDLGTLADGRPFLAMKLIKGNTLDELLKDRASPSADAGRFLAAFEQVCQAVAYAHAHRVIHRDLKPSNVMLGSYGEVQVMDWGLAKVLTPSVARSTVATDSDSTGPETEINSLRDDRLTHTGSVLGTPAYMPPEQAIGAVDQIDARSDVFGLGGILCAVLTGRPPFVGDTAESTRQLAARGKIADAFARLDACGADPGLIALAKRCLVPEKDDRPATAGEVAAAAAGLREAAAERARTAELERAEAEARAAEQWRKRKWQAAAAAAVLLLATGGAWWAVSVRRQADARRSVADRNAAAAAVALDQTEQALGHPNPAGGEIDALLTLARTRLADGGPDDVRARLDRLTRDRDMLRRLTAIDVRLWQRNPQRSGFDQTFAAADLPAAFREYGLDPVGGPADAVAERIRLSAIAEPLTAALHDWLLVGGPGELAHLLSRLDPDPARAALRLAYVSKDAAAIAEGVDKLDGRSPPAGFAAFVGGHPLTPIPTARRLLADAQAQHPGHFTLAMRAAVALQLELPGEAVPYFKVAIALRPENPSCHYNLGHAYFAQKRWAESLQAFRAAARLGPGVPDYRNYVGRALLELKDTAGAVAEWHETLRVDPNHFYARYNLGMVHLNAGNAAAAAAEARDAIRANPKYAAAYNLLGRAHSAEKDWARAIEAHRRGLPHATNKSEFHNNIGNAHLNARDAASAEQAYADAVRADPKNAEPHHGLAMLRVNRGDLDGAIDELLEAVRLAPGDKFLRSRLDLLLRIAPPPREVK